MPPSCESYQEDAAVRIMVYPVQSTSTFRIPSDSGGIQQEGEMLERNTPTVV
jgi:hypothetical protein